MYLGTLKGSVASAALAAGVFLKSILQVGDWANFYSGKTLFFQHISLPQIGTRIQNRLLTWVLVSSQPDGNCQALPYLFLWICWTDRLYLSLVLSK